MNNRTRRHLCLFFGAYFLLAFCAADFFHLSRCAAGSAEPVDEPDGCPACIFELGAHTEQPTLLIIPEPDPCIVFSVPLFMEQLCGSIPQCALRGRAPPV